jgi:hypothetical protein
MRLAAARDGGVDGEVRVQQPNLEHEPLLDADEKSLMWLQTEQSMESCPDFAKYIFARTAWPLLAK